MKPLIDVIASFQEIVIYITAMVLAILQTATVFYAFRDVRDKKFIRCSVLHLVIGFTVMMLLLYSREEVYLRDEGEVLPTLCSTMLAVPWGVYAGWELLSAVLLMIQMKCIRRYRNNHLTPDAVKESLDQLPVAVCISDAEGSVFLTNLKMNALARRLTNEQLTDFRSFWEAVTAQGEQQDDGYLLRFSDGRDYLFTKTPLILHEQGKELHFEQTFASDMTEIYGITQELSANNRHLKEVQRHIKAVAAYERSLIAAREVIKARTSVHNQMNSVLLCGKHFMDHPDSIKEEELLHLLEYNNFFQLIESEQKEHRTEKLDDAMRTAKRIGVTVEIEGILPEQQSARDVIAQAVEQCAANTVRHAEGDRLTVTLKETESEWIAEFRNNGKPPEEPVSESGGLWYLRKAAEEVGGTIAVRSEPVFLLTVFIPK